jgi:hypothetical protein
LPRQPVGRDEWRRGRKPVSDGDDLVGDVEAAALQYGAGLEVRLANSTRFLDLPGSTCEMKGAG